MRKVLALLLPALLLLTACSGSSSSEPLSSVKVSSNGENTVPTVEFDAPLSVDEPTLVRVNDGDGEELTEGQTASVRLVVLDPESGEAGQETYTAETAEDIAVDETLKQGNEQMYSALVGAPIGSDFAYYVPANETSGSAAQFIVFTLSGARDVPTRAWGTDVAPVDGLPTVTLAEDGKPTITIPEGEAPTELVAQELKTGDGAVVEADDTVTVQYHGVKYSDGTVFDSSWERGSSTSFGLDQVISAWTDGLAGKKVGSQVLIVAPPATAYGASEGNELQNETLVFVVDILEAK
ncbi:FKBP-type peptidyl-prolyl cis-trans isomerase [Arthrobacter sp. Sa2BUA2]|uniref:Peptidyl-prolyl cis-trans isomerase n=1 Tax=Arthrobacter pullicola TaxID=2762224 RepID=A0ABR8YHR2_9MICC|nr:FKBP-type peptidyl-prolyl cis-trans isomerase [Arthrobacter pullicola]MBD8043676.1 FKBP-type peptidyl-prolyl cis-trans isomerase [Arthrobacter pullicola]